MKTQVIREHVTCWHPLWVVKTGENMAHHESKNFISLSPTIGWADFCIVKTVFPKCPHQVLTRIDLKQSSIADMPCNTLRQWCSQLRVDWIQGWLRPAVFFLSQQDDFQPQRQRVLCDDNIKLEVFLSVDDLTFPTSLAAFDQLSRLVAEIVWNHN